MISLACLDTQSLTSLGTLTTACSSSPSPALPTMDLIQVMVIINKITIMMMMTGADGATDEPQIVTICPEHLLSLTRPTDVMMMMMMMTRLVIMVMMMKMMMDIIIS